MFSSYSWFGNDLQVPESNSTAPPDALIKIHAAKLLRFVAAGLAEPPQLGGLGTQSAERSSRLYLGICVPKKKIFLSMLLLNPEPFKIIKNPMQVGVFVESRKRRIPSLVTI